MLERYGTGEDVRSGSYYGDVSPNKNTANLAPAKQLCSALERAGGKKRIRFQEKQKSLH